MGNMQVVKYICWFSLRQWLFRLKPANDRICATSRRCKLSHVGVILANAAAGLHLKDPIASTGMYPLRPKSGGVAVCCCQTWVLLEDATQSPRGGTAAVSSTEYLLMTFGHWQLVAYNCCGYARWCHALCCLVNIRGSQTSQLCLLCLKFMYSSNQALPDLNSATQLTMMSTRQTSDVLQSKRPEPWHHPVIQAISTPDSRRCNTTPQK